VRRRLPSQEPPDEATGASSDVVGALEEAERVCVESSSVAVESVVADAETVVVACCAPDAARTATTPVVSAAAAAVAWLILTMRRLAALRFARDESSPVAGGASL
jgi:hypothetical protein